jgi:chromosome segregation ATPase
MLKEATIAELRQKLELSGASQLSTSALLESLKNETVRLQVQLAEANSQRSSIEAKLTEEQKLSAGLAADARTLTAARERVAQLEQAVSESNNRLARLEQAFTERDKTIAGEKNAREQANAELSARQAAVAQLQEKLEVARSQQQKLEADILKARSDNNRMQAQLAESKSKPQGRTTPGGVPPQDVAPPVPTAPGTSEGPDPMGVIDYVLKRKSR